MRTHRSPATTTPRRTAGHVILALALATGVALPAVALAADPATVVVAPFDGPKAYRYERESFKALEDADQKAFEAPEVGERVASLGLDLDKADDRVELCREYDAHALVRGIVEDDRRKWNVDVTIYDCADGSELGSKRFRDKEKKLKKTIRKTFWGATRDYLGKGEKAPPKSSTSGGSSGAVASGGNPAGGGSSSTGNTTGTGGTQAATGGGTTGAGTADTTGGTDEAAETEDTFDPEGTTQPLEIVISPRGLIRSFEYEDDLFSSLRPYFLPFGPSANIDIAWFPGGHVADGAAEWFGLIANFHIAFAIDSATADGGDSFPTTAYGWLAGVRARFPIGLTELGADIAFSQEAFIIENAGPTPKPLIPSVTYNALRFGAQARIGITDVHSILATFGYLLTLDAGELTSDAYFPHASIHGIYASLGYSIAVMPELEVRLSADLSHYFMSLNPEPDDAIFADSASVAGGARDDFIGINLGIAYRLFQEL